jgi:hypothetical protein
MRVGEPARHAVCIICTNQLLLSRYGVTCEIEREGWSRLVCGWFGDGGP